MPSVFDFAKAGRIKKALKLNGQPTSMRRCLKCDAWMRSTGPDHRICNPCKHEPASAGQAGARVSKASGGHDALG